MFSTIYLDLDDVLLGFDYAVCELFGLDYQTTMRQRAGNWCCSMWGVEGLNGDVLTQRIDLEGPSFWADLPHLPWLHELINLCYMYTENVTILTNPGTFQWSVVGKLAWYNIYCPSHVGFELEGRKERFANKTTLLIDDQERNCGRFIVAGGKSMLFPSYGNCKYKLRSEFLTNNSLVEEWFRNAIPIPERESCF